MSPRVVCYITEVQHTLSSSWVLNRVLYFRSRTINWDSTVPNEDSAEDEIPLVERAQAVVRETNDIGPRRKQPGEIHRWCGIDRHKQPRELVARYGKVNSRVVLAGCVFTLTLHDDSEGQRLVSAETETILNRN